MPFLTRTKRVRISFEVSLGTTVGHHHLAMPKLLDLPLELSTKLLCHLSLYDLVACQLTHSSLRDIITNSPEVQYHLATQLAGVEANTNSKISVHERIERLKDHEECLENFSFDFLMLLRIKVNNMKFSGVSEGVFWLDESRRSTSQEALYCYKLPRKSSEGVPVKKIVLEPTRVMKIGSAIHEHDLIVVIGMCVSFLSP